MDRSSTSRPEYPAAVQPAGTPQFHLLLSAASGKRGEFAAAAATRRTLHGISVLRQPAHGRPTPCQPQTHAAAHAHRRHRSVVSEAEPQPSGAGHQIYPNLLRGVVIERPDHVWSTD